MELSGLALLVATILVVVPGSGYPLRAGVEKVSDAVSLLSA